jgi:hypothetical protein
VTIEFFVALRAALQVLCHLLRNEDLMQGHHTKKRQVAGRTSRRRSKKRGNYISDNTQRVLDFARSFGYYVPMVASRVHMIIYQTMLRQSRMTRSLARQCRHIPIRYPSRQGVETLFHQ